MTESRREEAHWLTQQNSNKFRASMGLFARGTVVLAARMDLKDFAENKGFLTERCSGSA